MEWWILLKQKRIKKKWLGRNVDSLRSLGTTPNIKTLETYWSQKKKIKGKDRREYCKIRGENFPEMREWVSIPGIPQRPIQDKPREKHAMTQINHTKKNQTKNTLKSKRKPTNNKQWDPHKAIIWSFKTNFAGQGRVTIDLNWWKIKHLQPRLPYPATISCKFEEVKSFTDK